MTTPQVDPAFLSRLFELAPSVETKIENAQFLDRLSKLTKASDALGRTLIAHPSSIEAIEEVEHRQAVPSNPDAVAIWYRRELVRIAVRDLCGINTLGATGRALTEAAEDVLRVAMGDAEGLAIVSMGKSGGMELNYSSDVDVMFVGNAPASVARNVLDIARTCFRVDTSLRPEGRNGALVRSVDSYANYWNEWALPWEFQALLKARGSVGSVALLAEWTAVCEAHLWKKHFGVDEIASLRAMKQRTEHAAETVARTDGGTEIKRSRGGIRDVEFAVQLLQLVHGEQDPSIRSKNTLVALDQLAAGDYVSNEDATNLASSYEFLRRVEHRLQLIELAQTHTLPSDVGVRRRIASGLGSSIESFEEELSRHRARVRQSHERLYFRPLLEAFANATRLEPGAVEERLHAFGFSDAARTRAAIRELTTGIARSSRLMSQMMPVLLDWLSASPDPDQGLLGLRQLMSGFRTPSQIISAFRDSPETAQRVCLLIGNTTAFSRAFVREPDLFDQLAGEFVDVDYEQALDTTVGWREDRSDRLNALTRFKSIHSTRISMFDVLGHIDDAVSTQNRSSLADALLAQVLRDVDPLDSVALIAMGRYGGREIGPGSDLDLIVVYQGTGPETQNRAEAVAGRLQRGVSHPSPAFRLYQVDYDLRPEGRQGPIARSIAGCAEYYRNWASAWEKQALVRARYVAGNRSTADAFFAIVEDFVWKQPPDPDAVLEMRRLKARMENERISRHDDPKFHLKLGPGSLSDIEWTIQLQQLLHGLPETRTLPALKLLEDEARIDQDDASNLRTSWSFCQRVRNRLALIENGPANSLPSQPKSLSVLARSLGTDAADLRDEYLRVTRRARSVVERLFYGAEN